MFWKPPLTIPITIDSNLKRATQILTFLFVLTSCQVHNEDNFDRFIGQEKVQVIKQANSHFNDFLKRNFEGQTNLERTILFLTYLDTTSDFKPTWTLNLKSAKKIIYAYESSSLRNDFELYGYEEYDSIFAYDIDQDSSFISDTLPFGTLEIELEEEEFIPVAGSDTVGMKARLAEIERERQKRWDSTMHYNRFGRYQFGLKKYFQSDSFVCSYLKGMDAIGGNISPAILAGGLKKELEFRQELTEGTRLIILFELYLPYLRKEIKNCCQ